MQKDSHACRYGPPSHYSYFKRIAQAISNFKNIAKTVAIHHKHLNCFNLLDDGFFLKTSIITGQGTKMSYNNIIIQCHTSESYMSLSVVFPQKLSARCLHCQNQISSTYLDVIKPFVTGSEKTRYIVKMRIWRNARF